MLSDRVFSALIRYVIRSHGNSKISCRSANTGHDRNLGIRKNSMKHFEKSGQIPIFFFFDFLRSINQFDKIISGKNSGNFSRITEHFQNKIPKCFENKIPDLPQKNHPHNHSGHSLFTASGSSPVFPCPGVLPGGHGIVGLDPRSPRNKPGLPKGPFLKNRVKRPDSFRGSIRVRSARKA